MTARMLRAGDPAAIAQAAECLSGGGLVAFPTETVYGLGADASNGHAVAKLYAAKGRPAFNPLIVHVLDLSAARQLAKFDAAAEKLATTFWPGPLTLVLPKAAGCSVSDLATAGLETIAVRVPFCDTALSLIAKFGKPIVAPSANISGHVSPTLADHVWSDLKDRIDIILDGGSTTVGVESTVIACVNSPTLLRPGGIPRQDIARVLGHPVTELEPMDNDIKDPQAPGMLASHYAPRTRLRLNATHVKPGEALLAFGRNLPPGSDLAAAVLNLSLSEDLVEAAANLFLHLRALDNANSNGIAVMPIPHHHLGETINDRLTRAAAPKHHTLAVKPN